MNRPLLALMVLAALALAGCAAIGENSDGNGAGAPRSNGRGSQVEGTIEAVDGGANETGPGPENSTNGTGSN